MEGSLGWQWVWRDHLTAVGVEGSLRRQWVLDVGMDMGVGCGYSWVLGIDLDVGCV